MRMISAFFSRCTTWHISAFFVSALYLMPLPKIFLMTCVSLSYVVLVCPHELAHDLQAFVEVLAFFLVGYLFDVICELLQQLAVDRPFRMQLVEDLVLLVLVLGSAHAKSTR